MVKSLLTIAGLVLCAAGVQAQDTLQAQGSAPDLYLTHTVSKRENFYSLGRAYGLPPKEIAALNNLSFEQGLHLGQHVKIPLNKTNFVQNGDVNGARPIYHRVGEKETLYRISVNHNKVSLDNIRRWNNLSGDGVKKNTYVIIGWMKGTANAAAPAATAAAPPVTAAAPPPNPAPASPAPALPASTGTTEAKREQSPPPPSVTPAPPAVTPAPPVQQDTNTGTPEATTPVPATPAGSTFEEAYLQQIGNGKRVSSEKGPGSWFKSNASPGKYYALHNSAPRGTIIKVTNPLNGKSVYAKVLESIPQMKQNAGLIIKLSDSALEALGTNETRFYCELSYDN